MDTEVKATISLTVQITLNESEARALDAIFCYGPDAFIKGFYKQCGKYYLEPHAHAVPGLFQSVQRQLRPCLRRVDEARKEFEEN